jgi:UDP-3-O-[3-hydroxymyristoyl] glucosamine N-acyltransferase
MKLAEIARALGIELPGGGTLEVRRLVHPADATGAADLAMAMTPDAIPALAETKARAAVVKVGQATPEGVIAIAYKGHERVALAILTQMFDPGTAFTPGVDRAASVAPDATLGENVSIGPLASVGQHTSIGAGTVIHSGASVGADVVMGRDCIIHPGVRIADRVRIGDRVRIASNTVIGADGFSFLPVRNPDGSRNPIETPMRIHSLGTVVIADDVEIGAGTTIDRGTLRDTRIGRGTKIDNQVQIGHNVVIGEGTLVCGMVGIAGSGVIGDRVILAAGSGIADHVTIGSDATVGAGSGVASNVPAGTLVSGLPAGPHATTLERYMNIGRLRTLYPKVEDLKKRLEALETTSRGGEQSGGNR